MAAWPYNTTAWQRLRRAKLAQDPLCEYCPPAKVTAATEVDHRLAINKGGDPWAWANLASACGTCHKRKTNYVDIQGKDAVPIVGCTPDGAPLDPGRRWKP